MKSPFLPGLIFMSSLLAGCASVSLAPSSIEAEAKSFSPESGKANIYVYRGGSVVGGAWVPEVVLDGRTICGPLARNTFQLLSVSPGKHSITVIGPGWSSLAREATQESLVLAGRNYFFEMSILNIRRL